MTAQMLSVVGRIESDSRAAKMSTAHTSRLPILGGMRLAISARATSGSMGGSRSCGFVHADIKATPASTKTPRLLNARQLVVSGNPTIRREFIDGLRQFATQSVEQLLARHPGLLHEPLD